ncbi:MAG: DUF3857 domain-containing protein [Fidelibacterota bacterium]|nr:MAG: DUF3857 domain-containing protein [Candidatus Neomarinimicrobiota bacterium]
MTNSLLLKVVLLVCCLLPLAGRAEKKFEWQPITTDDWATAEDSARGIHDAVMIFEKIIADDRKWIDDKCYYSLYRRIRILSPEGREWGDVTAPYLHKEGKIERIDGRTVLADGREYALSKSQIYEKDIVRAKGVRIKQKSFSLPGVSGDCIIEYYIRYRMPESNKLWLIQKDIYLIEGEYIWKFYAGRGVSDQVYAAVSDDLVPNYLWVNLPQKGSVEMRPSIKEPEEVVFTIKDISAFEAEPYSPPEVELKALLRLYYGGSEPPAAYWGNLAKEIQDVLRDYTSANKRTRPIVEVIDTADTQEEKIQIAYEWVQEKINNTLYDDSDKKYKKNESVDDVLKREYGTAEDISIVFYDLLREMNIDAKMVYAIDRDENFLYYQAKYWQFDRCLVAVPNNAEGYDYYIPGIKYISPGRVPWFNENTPGFIVGDLSRQFVHIPASKSHTNRIKRYIKLKLDDNTQLEGTLQEERLGHSARSLRIRLRDYSEEEKLEYLSERFSDHFPNYESDSLVVEGLDELTETVSMKFTVRYLPGFQQVGNRLFLKPFDLFSTQEMPFTSVERKYSIMFDYANTLIEMINLELPGTMTIEALPPDSTFSNLIGQCQINFITFGNTLSIQRSLILSHPMVKAEGYLLIRELFLARQAFEEMAVIARTD